MDLTAELFKVCGVAILVAISLNLLGGAAGGIGLSLRIGGGVLVFLTLVFLVRESTELLEDLFFVNGEYTGSFAKEAFFLMLKALGVAMVSRFCADICRDCGEGTLANGVESVGKIVMVLLSLPVLAQILERTSEILDIGS